MGFIEFPSGSTASLKKEFMATRFPEVVFLSDKGSSEKAAFCICEISNVFALKYSSYQLWSSKWVPHTNIREVTLATT